MSDARFLVLVSLSDGPRHGYSIQHDIEALPVLAWERAPSTGRSTRWNETSSSNRCRRRNDDARTGSPQPDAIIYANSSRCSTASGRGQPQ